MIIFAAIVAYIAYRFYLIWRLDRPIPDVPIMSVRGLSPKDSWTKYGEEVLQQGLRTYNGHPFQVMTGTGPKLVFSNRYADEICRIQNAFSLARYVKPDMFCNYPGFEGVRYNFEPRNERRLPDAIRLNLTRSLGIATHELVEEAQESIHDMFGECYEWQEVPFKRDILHIIARLSSRILLGTPLCRDHKWLDIAKNYALDSFLAGQALRRMGSFSRPIRYWFTESCASLRHDYNKAKLLIGAEIARRTSEDDSFVKNQSARPRYDSMAWFMATTNGSMKPTELVGAQLGLAIAAIAPTSEATSLALKHLCEHPQFVQPLRDEITQVLSKYGWSRPALSSMKLLDSFLKESMRFGRGIQGIGRMATRDLVLSDGTRIRKGTRIIVAGCFWDHQVYGTNVHEFDAYRFLKKSAQTDQAHKWQYVSATPEFMGFGLGEHACPGRFFASNEMKIALSILLLKYDWSLPPKVANIKTLDVENLTFIDLDSKLMYRKRAEHKVLDSTD